MNTKWSHADSTVYPLLSFVKTVKLQPATWEETFTKTSDEFKRIQEEHGKGAVAVISTGQLLTEEFYALGKFTQLGLETNNYDGNTTLCMASAVMGYKQTFGSDGPTGCYEDFSKADVILLIGANIADNHPILKLHVAKNQTGERVRNQPSLLWILVSLKPHKWQIFLYRLAPTI